MGFVQLTIWTDVLAPAAVTPVAVTGRPPPASADSARPGEQGTVAAEPNDGGIGLGVGAHRSPQSPGSGTIIRIAALAEWLLR